MSERLTPEATESALKLRNILIEQEGLEKEPKPRLDQQEPSLSLRERVFRTLEEITTPKGT